MNCCHGNYLNITERIKDCQSDSFQYWLRSQDSNTKMEMLHENDNFRYTQGWFFFLNNTDIFSDGITLFQ